MEAQKFYYDQYQSPNSPPPQPPPPQVQPQPVSKPTGCCGLSRKALWIIIVVVVVAIGALAGGLAGGLTSHNRGSSSADSSPNTSSPAPPSENTNSTNTTGPTSGPLVDSQLAAINWTDRSNVQRRAVFYQLNGSLYLSQIDATSNKWTQFNISSVFDRETGSNVLNVKPGTPLAAAAVPLDDAKYVEATEGRSAGFSACLYFIDTSDHLREVYTTVDDLSSGWTQGLLKDASLLTADNTHLAALAYYCPNTANCTNQFIAVYQDTSQEIKMAYGPNWNNPLSVAPGFPGASVALIPLNSDGGRNLTDVSEMRLFYYTNTVFSFDYYNLYGLQPGKKPLLENTGGESF